jgi:hypothetical protein
MHCVHLHSAYCRAVKLEASFKIVIAFILLMFTISVQSVQMPAWLQRDSVSRPLTVGMLLSNDDKLITGINARVLLQAADGSSIKLGENAMLSLSNLSQQRDNQPLFTALLDVAKGAFRFTTSTVAKLRAREISIKVADATIGIRGIGVWGKDGDDKRLVCLIEGKISATGADKNEFSMDQPLTVYNMPKATIASGIVPVDSEQLGKWAMETEIIPGNGAAVAVGKWKVILLSAPDQAAALAAYDTWRNAGYAVRIVPVSQEGKPAYTLRIDQLPTHAEALALANSLVGKFGAVSPTVAR